MEKGGFSMKIFFAVALALFMLFNKPPEPEVTVSYGNWSDDSSIYFGSLNRKKMIYSSVQHLPIFRLDTLEDLEGFKKQFGDKLSMNQSYNEVPSFEEATSGYDDAFFEDNSLMLVYVPSSSGSLRFGVSEVWCENGGYSIHVETLNNPEAVTDDMAGWFITVAEKDKRLDACTEFDAIFV